jgi:polar amino acid transport system substrate-binding protein
MKKVSALWLALFFVAAASNLGADEILFGFRPVPPYVIEAEGKALSGMEYDIIVAALAVKGHTVKPQLFPLARLIETFKAGTIQGAAPILPSQGTGGTLSDVYLVYNNVALALKSKNLKIKTIADLKGLSVIAFQRATIVLGPDFAKAMEGNKSYLEEAAQVTQIRLVFAGRSDVAIGETRILRYFIKAPETNVDASVPIEEFRIFPPTEYRVAFANPKHAADFNEGLAVIKKNGTYDAIIAKYSK